MSLFDDYIDHTVDNSMSRFSTLYSLNYACILIEIINLPSSLPYDTVLGVFNSVVPISFFLSNAIKDHTLVAVSSMKDALIFVRRFHDNQLLADCPEILSVMLFKLPKYPKEELPSSYDQEHDCLEQNTDLPSLVVDTLEKGSNLYDIQPNQSSLVDPVTTILDLNPSLYTSFKPFNDSIYDRSLLFQSSFQNSLIDTRSEPNNYSYQYLSTLKPIPYEPYIDLSEHNIPVSVPISVPNDQLFSYDTSSLTSNPPCPQSVSYFSSSSIRMSKSAKPYYSHQQTNHMMRTTQQLPTNVHSNLSYQNYQYLNQSREIQQFIGSFIPIHLQESYPTKQLIFINNGTNKDTISMEILVGNLSHDVSHTELISLFIPYGVIMNAQIVKIQRGNQVECGGLISYSQPCEAMSAVHYRNGLIHKNRQMTVEHFKRMN